MPPYAIKQRSRRKASFLTVHYGGQSLTNVKHIKNKLSAMNFIDFFYNPGQRIMQQLTTIKNVTISTVYTRRLCV